ncbi:MAG: dynamin family protein [Zetaproteobacteria bacterium]|nr:dynamin family protein [Zetaproteobacteria bacterium]
MSIFLNSKEDFSFPQLNIPDEMTIETSITQFNDVDTVDDYRDLLLIILSAIANQDGELTIAKIKAYENAIVTCVDKEYIQNSINRLKFFYGILSPIEFTPKLCMKFHKSIEKSALSNDRRKDIANALVTMLEAANILTSSVGVLQLIKGMIDSLGIRTLEFWDRMDALQEKSKAFAVTHERSSLFVTSAKGVFENIGKVWRKEKATTGLAEIGTLRGILNEKATKKISASKIFAEEIHDVELINLANDFSDQIQPGKFRIVICGEVKHGKSSLFNLLVGRQISPSGESVATTASSIEIYHSPLPVYHAQWICEDDLQKVRAYFKNKIDDPMIARALNNFENIIQHADFKPGEKIESIGSTLELFEYLTAGGSRALLIQKVFVGLPIPYLEKGAVMVDTPGLNDPFQLREKITLDDARHAHCIIFVMRADKFGTHSEKEFLTKILSESATIKLLVVITHIDHLESEASKIKLMNEARLWLTSVAQKVDHKQVMHDIKIFGFDSRFDIKNRVSLADGHGYIDFIEKLQQVARNLHASGDYEAWLENSMGRLELKLEKQSSSYLQRVESALKQENKLSGLIAIKGVLERITDVYQTDTSSRLNEYRARLKLDYEELLLAFEEFQQMLIHKLSEAIERRVDELGDDYDLDRKWESFDQAECELICNHELQKFKHKIKSKIEFWNKTFVSFSEKEHHKLHSSAMDLMNVEENFANMCAISNNKERVFNVIDKGLSRMKDAGLLLSGAAAGSVGGTSSVIVLSSVSTLLSLPWALPILGFTATSIWAISKHIGTAEKRKRKFREIKVEQAREFIDKRVSGLKDKLKEDICFIDQQLVNIVKIHCNPVLIDSYASLKEIDLRLQLLNRISKSEVDRVNSRKEYISAIL